MISPRRRLSGIFSLWVIALLAPAPGARAAPARRVAVLPLATEGATEAQEAEVRRTLTERLGRRGLGTLAPAEVERLLVTADLSCTSRACLTARARTMKVDLLVGGRLGLAGSGGTATWTLECWLFDARRRQTVVTIRDECGACTAEQSKGWADTVAARLLEQARGGDRRARLVVASAPSEAVILLDGSAVGATPMELWVAPGEHTLVLRRGGYRLATRAVTARPGETARVEVTLERGQNLADGGAGSTDDGPGTLGVLKWTTAAAAVASLAAGITLLALDGRPTCETAHPDHQCSELHDTVAPGAVLTAAGGLAAAGAAVLFYLDRARDGGGGGGDGGGGARRAAILPTAGGGLGLSALLRF
jgi:hypothetical protein